MERALLCGSICVYLSQQLRLCPDFYDFTCQIQVLRAMGLRVSSIIPCRRHRHACHSDTVFLPSSWVDIHLSTPKICYRQTIDNRDVCMGENAEGACLGGQIHLSTDLRSPVPSISHRYVIVDCDSLKHDLGLADGTIYKADELSSKIRQNTFVS